MLSAYVNRVTQGDKNVLDQNQAIVIYVPVLGASVNRVGQGI